MTDTKRPTPPMLEVLRWLFRHPHLRISWTGGKDRPAFTAWWASEDARQHMIATFSKMDEIGLMSDDGVKAQTLARGGRNEGGTPTVTLPIVKGLLRRRLIRVVEKRRPMRGFSRMFYLQLTAEGKQAATGLTLYKTAELPNRKDETQ